MVVSGGLLAGCGNHISESKLPSVVVNAVKSSYTSDNKIEWEKVNDGYEAELVHSGKEITVLVNNAGKVVMKKEEIKAEELPAAVTAAIIANYASLKIDEVEKLEKDGTVYYQVELDGKGTAKDVDIVLTADGKTATGISFWK